MKIIRRCMQRLKKNLRRIHLVDRSLILIMGILLVQSAYSLLIPSGKNANVSDIDIIIRTSSAAIFGYFISANFMRHVLEEEQILEDSVPRPRTKSQGDDHGIQNRMGFQAEPEIEEDSLLEGTETGLSNGEVQQELETAGHLQTITALSVGIFCLMILIVLRNLAACGVLTVESGSAPATIAQFRDFVSGCVGFLIGSPTSGRR